MIKSLSELPGQRPNPRLLPSIVPPCVDCDSKEKKLTNGAGMIDARNVAEAWGWIAFRMVTSFALLVFAFLNFDRPTTQLCLVLLIAIGLASQGATQSLEFQLKALQQKLWMDELTNRIDAVRSGSHVDVSELYKTSTTSAASDIKSYVEGQDMFLQSISSKVFAALWSFAFNVFGYVIVYGAAYLAATFWRTGSISKFF